MRPSFNWLVKLLIPVNLFSVGGLILTILGFLLMPIFIGLPLMIVGIILLVGAILVHLLNFLPGGKILKKYLKSKIQNKHKINLI